MTLIFTLLNLVVLLYFLTLWARFILDLVRSLSREWRPSGAGMVAAEVVYTLTDPPLKLVRRVVKPVRIGPIALDLAFTIVILAVYLVMTVLLPAIENALT